MPQLVSPPGLLEDSPGSPRRSACPRSGLRLFGQGPAGQPRDLGVGAEALLGPCSLQATVPLNLQGMVGSGPAGQRAPRLLGGGWGGLCLLGPAHSGAGELPAPPHSSWRGAHRPPGSRGGD